MNSIQALLLTTVIVGSACAHAAATEIPSEIERILPSARYQGVTDQGKKCEVVARHSPGFSLLQVQAAIEGAWDSRGNLRDPSKHAEFTFRDGHRLYEILDANSSPDKVELKVLRFADEQYGSKRRLGIRIWRNASDGISSVTVSEKGMGLFAQEKSITCVFIK